jgi:DUF1009 family protein
MTTAMTRTEPEPRLQTPPGSRVGIVAGGGKLPVEVARALQKQGRAVFVVLLEGEADPDSGLRDYEHATLTLEDFSALVPLLKSRGVSHLVLAGEVTRRPRLSAIRLRMALLALVPSIPGILTGLMRGDDALLRALMHDIERRGVKVVGAHEIVPELIAAEGVLTRAAPTKSDWRDIEAAREAAEAIGALDIGQGAVAIGGRAIALEGVEGTNGMLERVKDLRGHGRLAGKTGGVLVKCAKPGQELRADLPAIGPQTVEAAHAAGLAGIAVEAGHSLVMDGPAMLDRANALGLFVIGLPAKGASHDT